MMSKLISTTKQHFSKENKVQGTTWTEEEGTMFYNAMREYAIRRSHELAQKQ